MICLPKRHDRWDNFNVLELVNSWRKRKFISQAKKLKCSLQLKDLLV